MIAAGVGAELLRRRRRQLARRLPHERLPELTEPAAAAAATVAYGPVDDVDWLACELRLLVRGLSGPARARFEATVVQYHAQSTIEVGLARSCGTPPEGWSAGAGGKVWTLDAPHSPAELASVGDLPPCLPLLVSLGDEDTNGQVLLNLEAASAVGVVGDPAMVDALVRSVLWELATSPLAEQLALVTLGVEAGDAQEIARWRPAVDVDDVAATLRRATAGVDGALAAADAPTLPTARALGNEAWGPTVAVVAARFATPEVLDAASGTGAVVVVVGACPPDGLEVHVAGGEVALPSIGLVCVAQQLTRAAADALASLLVEAAADPVPAAPEDDLRLFDDVPATAEGAPEELQPVEGAFIGQVDVDRFVPDRPAVLVRLLGPPSAEGTVKRVTPQQLSALAYMATHPDFTRSQVKDAVWGDKHPTDKRWREFLSELRDTLPNRNAVTVQGDLVRTTGDLGSDVDQLEWLLSRAKASTGPKDRLGYLQAAVDLLRGVAFGQPDPTVSRYWRWLDIEYTNGHLWMQLTQAAYELGNLYLDAGDPAAAVEVARKVLATARLDEGLTAVLMEAYRAQGSPDAAEKVYAAYDALMEEDGEAAGEMTRRVIERIREERRDGFNGRPGRLLTLVRGPG